LSVGPVVKQGVGQGAANALVEQDEQGSHTRSLVGKAVGVLPTHSLEQTVAFHLVQVITELIESVGLWPMGVHSETAGTGIERLRQPSA
jgi:hypothetical protein